jgi:glycosyltransferase involved in cell wall biosynthesis
MDQTFQAQLNHIKEVDLLIGIPSYNSGRTIGHVVRAVIAGLAKYFPGLRAVLVISDGGSTDGTQDEVKRVQVEDIEMILTSHSVPPIHKIVLPYYGIPGKENGLRRIFEATQWLKAKACAVVDSDLRSMTPEWMEFLLRPVYEEGFDYVVPIYARHKFDGTITNGIVYPLNRALYGKRVRQFVGGDFGFSGELAKFYLTKEDWETDLVRFGIDIWMTTLAISEGYKVCQSFLGPKIYEAKNSESDLGSIFSQILSSVYGLMGPYQNLWKTVKETEPVPTFGRQYEMTLEPISVNVQGMIRNFRLGIRNLMEIWNKILAPETASSLKSIDRLSDEAFSFPQDLWVQLVYDFAVAHHRGSVHRDHLLKSMIPLYLGQVASFVKENQESSPEDVEEKIESLCRIFEEMKPYLIGHWNEGNEAKEGGG